MNKIAVKKKNTCILVLPILIVLLVLDRIADHAIVAGWTGRDKGQIVAYVIVATLLPVILEFLIEDIFCIIEYAMIKEPIWYVRKDALENPAAQRFVDTMRSQSIRQKLITQGIEIAAFLMIVIGALYQKGGQDGMVARMMLFLIVIQLDVIYIQKKRTQREESVINLLYEDCDPKLCADVNEILLSRTSRHSEMVNCWYRLAQTSYFMGDGNGALNYLRKLPAKYHEGYPEVLALYGYIYIDRGMTEQFNACTAKLYEAERHSKMHETARKYAIFTHELWDVMIAMHRRDYENAKRFIDVKLSEDLPRAYRMLSSYYLGLLQYETGSYMLAKQNLVLVAELSGSMQIATSAKQLLDAADAKMQEAAMSGLQ